MKLYLSSMRLGAQPHRLPALLNGRTRAAVIVNACDLMSDDERRARLDDEVVALRGLGLSANEIDLRHHFGDLGRQRALGHELDNYDLIWVRGGNSFVLRRAMQASGLDLMLHERLAYEAMVYGGYSAAIAVLTPSLRGIELVDDARSVPPGYEPDPVWDGLAFLPYAVAPHYRSDHPESADIERVIQYYIDHHVPFVALRDGEVIIVDGNRREVVS